MCQISENEDVLNQLATLDLISFIMGSCIGSIIQVEFEESPIIVYPSDVKIMPRLNDWAYVISTIHFLHDFVKRYDARWSIKASSSVAYIEGILAVLYSR